MLILLPCVNKVEVDVFLPQLSSRLSDCFRRCCLCNGHARATILLFQNNEAVALLVFQTNPVGVELFSHVNALSSLNLHRCWPRE